MLIDVFFDIHISSTTSLGIVLSFLSVGIIASFLFPEKEATA
jgi:hypothetical protein